MKKTMVSPGRLLVMLLLLAGLAGCQMAEQQSEAPPPDALSHDQIIADLDALQESATGSLAQSGKSLFLLPGGVPLSARDLSTYLNAIKSNLASFVSQCTGGSPYLVVAKKVSWASVVETPLGQVSVTESGLMWVPFTWGRLKYFPIISYQHGTQVYQDCAPSRFNANPLAVLYSRDVTGSFQNYVECLVGALMASAGYVVVMPDYVGFGDCTAFDHPYVHRSLGNSVAGIVGRATGILGSGLVRWNGEVFLTGYSEGGYATMVGAPALQAAGIPVTATIPCDGAYDLSGTMLTQMLTKEVLVPSYLLYTASGYHAVYGDAGFTYAYLLEHDYAALLAAGLFDGTHTNAYIEALGLPSTPVSMLTDTAATDLLNKTSPVYSLLVENNAWVDWVPVPPSPVCFVHCPADDVVPFDNANQAVANLPPGIARIQEVPALPFVDTLLGSKHVAAYPTAMLAAFVIINGS
jgi:hypothetical protein